MLEDFDRFLTSSALGLTLLLALAVAGTAWRMLRGPGHADRIVSIDMLTGIGVALCALGTVSTGRREYMDVGLGLALIGFMSTIAFAAFLERKGRGQ